jgi:hypothetical protein
VLEPAQVAELDTALAGISDQEFGSRFDPIGLAAAEVYPQIWDEPAEDLKQEYGSYFQEMKRHIHHAAQEGLALVVTIR